jgi:hypothetical protein
VPASTAAPHWVAQFEFWQLVSAAPAAKQAVLMFDSHALRHVVSEQSHFSPHVTNAEQSDSTSDISVPQWLCAHDTHAVLLVLPVAGGFLHVGKLPPLLPLLPKHAARAIPPVSATAPQKPFRMDRPPFAMLAKNRPADGFRKANA